MIDENNVSETRESLEAFTESQPNGTATDNKNDKPRGERSHAAREKLADDFFALLAISRRTLKIFLLDKAAVLFSLLAPLILLLLYTLFLGDVQIAAVKNGLPGGVELSDAAIKAFIDSWVAAGVMSVGCITVSLSANTVMVQDRERGLTRDALASPVGGGVVTLGYFLYNFTVTLFICSVVFAVCLIYLAISGSFFMTAAEAFSAYGVTVLSCLSSTLVNVFISGFFRTNSAFSAFVGIVSAVVGFVIGAYMPVSILPVYVRYITCLFPGSYSAGLFRSFFMRGALGTLAGGSGEVYSALASSYAVEFDFFGLSMGSGAMAAVLSGTVVLFLIVNIIYGTVSVRRKRA